MAKNKKRKSTKGYCVLALYDYNPDIDEYDHEINDKLLEEHPENDKGLQFKRGDIFHVISDLNQWWLFCCTVCGGKKGFVPSVYFAPLKHKSVNKESTESSKRKSGNSERNCTLTGKVVPIQRGENVDFKYFPNAPVARKKTIPEETANIFSRLSFWWLTSLMVKGFKRPLTDKDLWELQPKNKVRNLQESLSYEWDVKMEKHRKSPLIQVKEKLNEEENNDAAAEKEVLFQPHEKYKFVEQHKYKPSISKAVSRAFGIAFILAAMIKIMHDCLVFVSPYLLGKLILFIKNGDEDVKWGYILAVLLLLTVCLQSILLQQYFYLCNLAGMRARSALISFIYKKMFSLSSDGKRKFTVGEMVNLISVDSQKFFDILTYLNLVWSGPFQILVGLGFLYFLMGWSIFAGFFVMVLLVPLNLLVASKEKKITIKKMKHKDQRSKFINEVLNSIKIIKFYAWEYSFMEKIENCRKAEMKELRKAKILKANYQFSLTITPFVVSMATFGVYVLSGNELTAEKAFVAISLFNIIRFPFFMLPQVISNVIQFKVSANRIANFLQGNELDGSSGIHSEMDSHVEVASIKDGYFSWEKQGDLTLKRIDVDFEEKKLTAIVGQVGAGKSSLLSALLGEMHRQSGEVAVFGKIAYVAQQPWIQNTTLRENVLFGKPYVKEKYDRIIEACSLKSDLELLPGGDLTEIGEKGINLSGGQKQRVALARAVYNNADIYIFDDPLSAVDVHVGKHIFHHVIANEGMLKDKTRIMVTHNLTFLPKVDKIIVLKNGEIAETGTYHHLVASGNSDFADFLNIYMKEYGVIEIESDSPALLENNGSLAEQFAPFTDEERQVKEIESNEQKRNSILMEVDFETNDSVDNLNQTKENGTHRKIISSDDNGEYAETLKTPLMNDYELSEEECKNVKDSLGDITAVQEVLNEHSEMSKEEGETKSTLIQEEKAETGKVDRSVFLTYAGSLGYFFAFIVILLAFCVEGLLIGTRMWLAEWSSVSNITSDEQHYYLGIYGAIGGAQAVSIWLENLILAYCTIKSSVILHRTLLKSMFRSSMTFFETTPMGRIVTRFSKDIHTIDESIPQNLKSFLSTFTTMVGTIFVISYSTPIFLSVLLPIAFIYFLTQRFYVASSRQLKRIESVKRSPIYNHFFESIYGASTIRAFGYKEKFIEENIKKVDVDQAAWFPSLCANRWLAIRIEFAGNLITFFAALFCIINRDSISPGIAGLSVSYALQVTQTLNWLVRMTSEIETNIISVERVKEYIDTPSEAAWEIKESKPSDNWPPNGEIVFQDYSVRYREGLDLALKNIDCHIQPREKVGIVGRTGAGKSTLTTAVFRIIEAFGGKILVDGIDIATLGLKDLRSKLTVIPQDPVLFCGTLRYNLDPFNECRDEEIWHVLEVTHLKEFVEGLSDCLQHTIVEGGENLSIGQRQLICLGRALLRKTKILILDEATAAVDMETDAFIQRTIREEFKDSTILTIAHRLHTIIDYDKIMVLSSGELKEFAPPDELMADKTSIFYCMAKDAGLVD